jgi:bifunctional DNA-binding transcriptional regulator/antitoxin component of YhaV-PrlF toxin-antitoxin module
MPALRKSAEGKMTSKGQLTVPASVRGPMDMHAGDRLLFEIVGPDRMMVTVKRKRNVFDVLKALPKLRLDAPLDRATIDEAADEALTEKFKDVGERKL